MLPVPAYRINTRRLGGGEVVGGLMMEHWPLDT